MKANRVVSCAPLREDLIRDGQVLIGLLTGRVKAKILRHGGKYLATNRLTLTRGEIVSWYRVRWKIEEVFRFLKDQLRLEEYQARVLTAQETHLASCVLAYLLIQKEKATFLPTQSLYQVRISWILDKRLGLNRLNHYVKVLSA